MADRLLARASMLDADELVMLGSATNKAMGAGLWPRREWLAAEHAAVAAAERAGRRGALEETASAVAVAVVAAALSAAQKDGRSIEKARAMVDNGAVLGVHGGPKRRRDFHGQQRVLRRALGLRVQRRLLMAAAGASASAIAAITWDLAEASGPYTPSHRSVLYAPWRNIS